MLNPKVYEYTEKFLEFWAAYPRKIDKKGSLRIWTVRNLEELAEEIIAGVERHKKYNQNWKETKFIVHPSKFLSAERWTEFKEISTLEAEDNSVDFYSDWKWKKIRYEILSLCGARCMLCGATRNEDVICVDHIKPRSKYPDLELDKRNLQILCKSCNMGKSNTDETDYRPEWLKKYKWDSCTKWKDTPHPRKTKQFTVIKTRRTGIYKPKF